MSRQSDELRKYFDRNGIKQKDVMEATGASHSTISNMLKGRFGISKDMAQRLASAYGFNLSFLLTGEGELIPPPGIPVRRPASPGVVLSDGGDAFIAEITNLRAELERERGEKQRLLGIIETLTTTTK